MHETFAEKFERALRDKKQTEPGYGLRTLARQLAKDEDDIEIVRRRLHKYRPKPNRGGAGEVAPTEPTRWEIEDAMGLERDTLAPDPVEMDPAAEFIAELAPLRRLFDVARMLERGEIRVVT